MRIEITSLLDLDVYTQKGIFVGRVDDAVLDMDRETVGGLALGNVNKNLFDFRGKGIVVPYEGVAAVGDVVLIRHPATKENDDEKRDR